MENEPENPPAAVGLAVPQLSAHKLKTASEFKAGLVHFFARNFPEAGASFGKVLKSNSGDQVARLFLHKTGRYIHEGVPEDWTGVEVMMFK